MLYPPDGGSGVGRPSWWELEGKALETPIQGIYSEQYENPGRTFRRTPRVLRGPRGSAENAKYGRHGGPDEDHRQRDADHPDHEFLFFLLFLG